VMKKYLLIGVSAFVLGAGSMAYVSQHAMAAATPRAQTYRMLGLFGDVLDTVNAAFRLETTTKELKTDIVLGKNTFDYLRPLPDSIHIFGDAKVKLKGYDTLADTWFISFARLREFLQKLDANPSPAKI